MGNNKRAHLFYTRMESPVKDMSHEEIGNLVRSFGQHFVDEFPEKLASLEARLKDIYPFELLSILSFYYLSVSVGSGGELTEKKPIQQHHVETIQALVLKTPKEKYPQLPIQPQRISEIEDLVQDVTRSVQMRRFAAVDPSMSLGERERLALLSYISGHTQAVRNWGYPQQIRRIIKQLFAPLDDRIEKTIGVRVAHLVEMLFKIIELIEERINVHHSKLLPVISAPDVRSAVYAYYESFPNLAPEQEEFLAQMKDKQATLAQVKAMILSHADLRLEATYTLSIADFVACYPENIDSAVLQSVLDNWSFALGDLADEPTERLFLANPVWEKPLIRKGENAYFLPIPGLILSFCLEMIELVVAPNSELHQKYKEIRGQFLEDILYDLCVRAFPHASIFRGSMWRAPETQQEYENDLLILNDTFLLIVEAKSGKVNPSARRGGALRLERTLDELIAAPALQSKRFADFLRQNPGTHRFGTRRGIFNKLDTSAVQQIVRLNVTLELVGDLISRQSALQRAGLIAVDHEIVPTICYPDLEVIFELLEGTCAKFHYLKRRGEFEAHADYLGDEMDLLAFYLDTGFNIGETEFDDEALWLFGLSETLEPYFMQEWTNVAVKKPQLRLTKWWKDLLQLIEERRLPRWVELGCILLNTQYKDQLSFEQKYHRRKAKVHAHWGDPDVKNILLLGNGPPQRREVIAALMYKKIDKERRNHMMRVAVNRALEDSNAQQGVILGIDIEQQDYPYSVLGLFERNQEQA